MKQDASNKIQAISKRQGGFAMLLTVLLGLTIFGLILTALLMMVTMETRRSVAQNDTNAAFYAAEGLMHKKYYWLDISSYPPPGYDFGNPAKEYTEDCSVGGAKIDCILSFFDDGTDKYVEIDVAAKVGRAKRAVAGVYERTSGGGGGGGGTPDPWENTEIIFKGTTIDGTGVGGVDNSFSISAGNEFIIKKRIGGWKAGVVMLPGDYTGESWQIKPAHHPWTANPGAKISDVDPFVNEKVWECINGPCPPYEWHRGHRVIVGIDPADSTKLKSFNLKGMKPKNPGPGYEKDYDSGIDVTNTDVFDLNGLVAIKGWDDETDNPVAGELLMFPVGYELTISPQGILDDDGEGDGRENHIAITHPLADPATQYVDHISQWSVYRSIDLRMKYVEKDEKCIEDGSAEDTLSEAFVSPACKITVPTPSDTSGFDGGLVEIVYGDSVLTILGGSIEAKDPKTGKVFTYKEVDPDP